MKFNNKRKVVFVLLALITVLFSCKKDDSKQEYGFSKIYMPQANLQSGGVNANYLIPSGTDTSTYNYNVNRTSGKVEVILGASLSGPGTDAYTVDIVVNNDTVQRMFNNRILDTAQYKLMPASMYTIPTSLEVPQGSKSGTFVVLIDIVQLKMNAYANKYLVLAVKLANSTKNPIKYELNPALSTTIIIIDVNALVIGPAVNVTGLYLKNSGAPFLSNGFMSGSNRWGNLKDWSANATARSHGGFGGFSSDNSGTMNMESGWGSPQILNGKIYQTIPNLPAGSYTFDLSGGNWSGGEYFLKDVGYMVVAPASDTLPDYNNILNNNAVFPQAFMAGTQPIIKFKLNAASKVTVGTVVNYAQTEQGFKTKQVFLINYPKAL